MLSALPRAIISPVIVYITHAFFFPNCTRIHMITYTCFVYLLCGRVRIVQGGDEVKGDGGASNSAPPPTTNPSVEHERSSKSGRLRSAILTL